MRKIILFFIILVLFCVFVNASGDRVVVMKNSFLDKDSFEGKKEVTKALENLLAKHGVEFRIEFISKDIANNYPPLKSRFYLYSLDKRAISSLNLLFTYFEDQNGVPQLDISYSENCGWTEEGLNSLVDIENKNPKQKDFWLQVIKLADEKLTNFDSEFLKTVCQMQEEKKMQETKCKYFFPKLEEKRTKASFAKIVFVFEEYDKEDYGEVKEHIENQLLDLKENYNLWDKHFEEFEFVYVDEVMFDVCDGNFDENIECYIDNLWEVAGECSPYQKIAVISENFFRSYASSYYMRFSIPLFSLSDFGNFFHLSRTPLFAHEFGHSLFCLADEYVESWFFGLQSESIYGKDYSHMPNCAPDIETAQQWWGGYVGQGKGDLKVGYYEGCSYVDKNIRPHEDSIMCGNREEDYGIVNEKHAENILNSGFLC